MKKGGDPNIVYPEESHDDSRNGIKIMTLDEQKKRESTSSAQKQQPKRNYKCTIAINYAQHNTLKSEKLVTSFTTLARYGLRLDGEDSDGLTVLDHAIMKNNEVLVDWLLANRAQGLDLNHRQPDGKTSVHTCIKPLAFGSYENVSILEKLHGAGFDLHARDDASSKTPLDYAMEFDSKTMAKALCRLID